VDAERAVGGNFGGVIYRPHMNAQSCVSSGFQKRGCDNILPRVNCRGAQLARLRHEIFEFLSQEPNRNFRREQTEFMPIEGRYDGVPFEPFFEKEPLQIVAEPGIFQLDVKDASCAEFLEHIGKERNGLAMTSIEFLELFI